MFTYTELLVGPLLPKQKMTIEFPYNGIVIKNLRASCGCSNVRDDKERQRVMVEYTAQDIPVHLYNVGSYTSKKEIFVTYTVENSEQIQEITLSFKATVTDGKRRN
jgi:hypothetical protein